MRAWLALTAGLVVTSACGAVASDARLGRAIGKALFDRAWVAAPSSTKANDGLGPVFNARACVFCHQSLGRAGSDVGPDGRFVHDGMVLKLSDAAGRFDPGYGGQLQTSAVSGIKPEGRAVMTPAGAEAKDLAYGPFGKDTRIGVRAAPALRGLGLLAEVPDEAIVALADPDDRNGDGISGRVNWIVGPDGKQHVGRFGLKASGATLTHQIETAFSMDIGLSTDGMPKVEGDCPQKACRNAPNGSEAGQPEIRHDLVAMLADYLANVPPPPAPVADPEGERLFAATGCASCHVPSMPTAKGQARAFTDLLLHDLGAGLDGGATEPGVAATEWRTAPLWGVSRALAAHAGLLHDGRAATVADAVALHGGEAAGALARFDALNDEDRNRLLAYVEGL
ncbi:di-heme oxidoredictase family protein [Flaviflagellibacter deserti]|uniref:Di-heme oxidoredictase family protein n=1 Tax=Flaviflagellibacter deserti TaxID=2267266 RepID=A0ABV9Z475_9HYPH